MFLEQPDLSYKEKLTSVDRDGDMVLVDGGGVRIPLIRKRGNHAYE